MAERLSITASATGLLVGFRVSPAAGRTRIQGVYGDRVKVQVSAPPEGHRANAELVSALAGWLEMPPDCVALCSGHKGRDKLVAFSNIAESDLRARLARLLERRT